MRALGRNKPTLSVKAVLSVTWEWLLLLVMSPIPLFNSTPLRFLALASSSPHSTPGCQGSKGCVTINLKEKISKLMLGNESQEWFSQVPGWESQLMPLRTAPILLKAQGDSTSCSPPSKQMGTLLSRHFSEDLLVFLIWPKFGLMIWEEGLWCPFIFSSFKKFKWTFEILLKAKFLWCLSWVGHVSNSFSCFHQ